MIYDGNGGEPYKADVAINADTIASEIAAELGAEKLILLSDVNGIYLNAEDKGTKLSRLTTSDAQHLIDSGRVRAVRA